MTAIKCDQETTVRLLRKRRGLEEVELLIRGLHDLLAEERKEYFTLLAGAVSKSVNAICGGVRPCEASPVETCVYEYTAEDVCLFCGLPNELEAQQGGKEAVA